MRNVGWIKCRLRGGPWAGHMLLVPPTGTMVFTVNGQRGRYNENGKWEAVGDDNRFVAEAG